MIIPIFNEEEALPALIDRLRPILDELGAPYEVLAVDDGSRDGTGALLLDLHKTWPELRVVQLRRNAGHQAALTAGMHRAAGDYVVSIDADLQDPPEMIPYMLDLAHTEGCDVVYGVRSERPSDYALKRAAASAYYRLIRRLVGTWVPRYASDYRLLSRRAVDTLNSMPEKAPAYRLLVPSLCFPSGEVSYVREHRVAGDTKRPRRQVIRLALDSITSFSAAPLRLATVMGLCSFVTCAGLIFYALTAYFTGHTVPGWTSLFVAVLLLGAVQLVSLGLLGEYIARLYVTAQARPTYHVSLDTADEAHLPTQAVEPERVPAHLAVG